MLSGFYEESGVIFPIDRITQIGREHKYNGTGAYVRAVRVGEGDESHEVVNVNVTRMLARASQLIPAEPGCRLVRVDEGKVWGEPLIAWALCLDGEIRAVTANGVSAGCSPDADYFVQMPDGSVQAVGEWTEPCCFASVDEFVAHFTPARIGGDA